MTTLGVEYGRGHQSWSSFTRWITNLPRRLDTNRRRRIQGPDYGLKRCIAIRQVARRRRGLFAVLDDDGSTWWAWAGGGGTERRAILAITTACCQLKREVGCCMRWGCSILPTRLSPSREVPWPPIYVEGRATEGRFARKYAYGRRTYQALPNTNMASFGTPREDYGFVSGCWRSHFVHDIWRLATNAPRTMATRTG
ncbi:hypothetical protein ARMSODRAFT_1028196 [Armillaria solidipes]|nr:hypothetical protein ARMSODRAFT_1028196 [Armillaria solidipes]